MSSTSRIISGAASVSEALYERRSRRSSTFIRFLTDRDTGTEYHLLFEHHEEYPDGRPVRRWLTIGEFRAFTGLTQGQIDYLRENERHDRDRTDNTKLIHRSFKSLKRGHGKSALFDSWGYLDWVLAEDRDAIAQKAEKDAIAKEKARRKAEREAEKAELARYRAEKSGTSRPSEIPAEVDLDEDGFYPASAVPGRSGTTKTYSSNPLIPDVLRRSSFSKFF